MKHLFLSLFFFATLALEANARVVVTIQPQAWFVEQLGVAPEDITVLLRPGENPHTFQMTPGLLREISRAEVWFQIGLPMEAAIDARLGSMETLRVVKLTAGLPRRAFTALETAAGHDHHHHHEGHEGGVTCTSGADPHLWLSTELAEAMLPVYAEALDASDAKVETVRAQIVELRAALAQQLEPFAGRGFLVFHPSFGYFAQEFGLVQLAIEMEGRSPTPRQLREVLDVATAHGVRTIFAQPQFDRSAAETVAQSIGAEVVELDGLSRDWPSMMWAISAALAEGFAQ